MGVKLMNKMFEKLVGVGIAIFVAAIMMPMALSEFGISEQHEIVSDNGYNIDEMTALYNYNVHTSEVLPAKFPNLMYNVTPDDYPDLFSYVNQQYYFDMYWGINVSDYEGNATQSFDYWTTNYGMFDTSTDYGVDLGRWDDDTYYKRHLVRLPEAIGWLEFNHTANTMTILETNETNTEVSTYEPPTEDDLGTESRMQPLFLLMAMIGILSIVFVIYRSVKK